MDSRQRIIDTARDKFHGRSYADVGVKEICDSAGVQKGSFYHHFESKRDLALAVIDDFVHEWTTNIVNSAFDPAIPPMQRFDRLREAIYEWQMQAQVEDGTMPGCPFGNLALEVSTQEDLVRNKLQQVFGLIQSRLRATLDEAVGRGEIAPLDSEQTALAMIAMLEGIMLVAKTHNDPELIRSLGVAVKVVRIELK
ncbi:MAG: TetR/AcrR family transcriptional regulator [bacterium]